MAKKKPCEWCEGEQWNVFSGQNGHQLYVEIYPDSNYIGVTSFGADDSGESEELKADIPMNYCPNCGRKLD